MTKQHREVRMEHITAKVSCFARAYHYRNHPRRIFADEAAGSLLGEDYDRIAKSMMDGISFFLPGFKGTREEGLKRIADHQLSPSVLGRSAYCEKKIENEILLGCSQIVIFASGYDTFSIRNRDKAITVYELDLPQTLIDKEERVRLSGLESSAVYVPCDLSDPGWTDQLKGKGYDPGKKSFGSMLGICYYLSKEEWANLLHRAAGIMPRGSAICFDYPSNTGSRETRINQNLAEGAGERMKAAYSVDEMETLLGHAGFLVYEHLRPEDMTLQFFSEYNEINPDHPISAPEGVEYILAVLQG